MSKHCVSVARRSVVFLFTLAALAIAALSSAPARGGEVLVKSGEKIAFLGDSITAQGNASPSGYVRLVISGLETNGVHATAIPAGISGHTSRDMLARLEHDVISKKPDWMTLSCGVNDVWHGATGVQLDQYKKNITEIVDKCQAAGIKVMLLTSTMITEDQTAENNKKLVAYNEFLHELAKEKKCPLADLNAEMQKEIASASSNGAPHKGNLLTVDGVHMNPRGNVMMASGVLKGFGLDEAQLHKAHQAWLDMPGAVETNTKITLTMRQYEQLAKVAESQGKSVSDLINAETNKVVEAILKAAPHEEPAGK